MNTIACCHRLSVRWVKITLLLIGSRLAAGTVTRIGRVGRFIGDHHSALRSSLARNRVDFGIAIVLVIVFLI